MTDSSDVAALPWADLPAFRAAYRAGHPLPLLAAVVPDLAARRQWLLWRYEPGETPEKKPRKMPYYAGGSRRVGDQGSSRDRERLTDAQTALYAAGHGDYDGIGFAFLPGDGLIGIDLDGMVDPETGEVAQRLRDIVAAVDSYTEWSPSGKGVHLICAGETETFKSNKVGVEVFCGRQYFTFTAQHWEGSPAAVRPIADEVLRRLRVTVKGKRPGPDAGPPAAPDAGLAAPPAAGAPAGPRTRSVAEEVALVESALAHVDPDDYAQWIEIGMALKAGSLGQSGFVLWDAWSARSAKYAGAEDTRKRWDGFKPEKVTLGTVFGLAEQAGWRSPWAEARERKGKRKRHAASAAGEGAADGQPDGPPDGPPEPPDTPSGASPGNDDPEGNAWRRLLYKRDDRLVDCRENVYLTLRHHPAWRGVLHADVFARRIVMRAPPPWWPEDAPLADWHAGVVFSEQDHLRLGLWLMRAMRMLVKSTEAIAAAVGWAASESPFNPVTHWMDGLRHDGTPRLDTWLTDFLGAKPGEYSRLAGRMWLIGMVARAYRPGCQMRVMPILEGPQFKGKSEALRALAAPWFGDTPLNLSNKDTYQQIQGCLIYEIGELDAMNKAEVTAVKAFVSSRSDRFRAPYARAPEDQPRQGIFCGTTNHTEYLKDMTGNTRFWPIKVEEVDDLRLDGLKAARDQLVAEAVACFKAGERWHPTREEQEEFFAPEQEEREIGDPWEERIADWLVTGGRLRATTLEVLTDCLKVEVGKIDSAKSMSTRVGNIMKRMGWVKRREGGQARGWFYASPKASPAQLERRGDADF